VLSPLGVWLVTVRPAYFDAIVEPMQARTGAPVGRPPARPDREPSFRLQIELAWAPGGHNNGTTSPPASLLTYPARAATRLPTLLARDRRSHRAGARVPHLTGGRHRDGPTKRPSPMRLPKPVAARPHAGHVRRHD
jgi:hypothetical protein